MQPDTRPRGTGLWMASAESTCNINAAAQGWSARRKYEPYLSEDLVSGELGRPWQFEALWRRYWRSSRPLSTCQRSKMDHDHHHWEHAGWHGDHDCAKLIKVRAVP